MKTLPGLDKRALRTSVAVGALLMAPLAHAANLDLHNSTGTVTGTETYDSVFVGDGDNQTGSLTVSSGGTLTTGSSGSHAYVGTAASATGTVVVDGPGSSWTSNSDWTVIGYHGTGSLTVSNSGTVTTKQFYAGLTDGASGTVTVTGTGSLLKATDGMTIGAKNNAETSTGSLTIENGGAVETVSEGLYLTKNSTLSVTGPGSSLKVGTEHSGTPSTWTDTDGWFSVGHASVTASGGATLEVDGLYVTGDDAGHTGTVSLSGPGTTMDAHLLIYVGGDGNGNGHDGAVTLSGGATASASVIVAGQDSGINGSILLTGTGTSLSSIPNPNRADPSAFLGNVYAGSYGNGTITVQNGAALSASNELRIGYASGSNGKLIVGAAEGQTATGAGAVSADQGIQFGAGNGALILNHTDTDYTIASAISSINAGDGTIRNLAGTTKLTGDGSGFSGALSVEGGTLQVTGNLGGSSLSVGKGSSDNGALTVSSGGTLTTGGTGETWIGKESGAVGAVTVSGTGSSWTDTNSATGIGAKGTGSLTVRDGATATVKNLQLGSDTGGNSSISLSGAGSHLTSTNGATMANGNNSTVTIQVEDGATFETVSQGVYIDKGGSITVTGQGSAVRIGTEHSGTPLGWDDSDGWFANGGSVTVSNGATLEADGVDVKAKDVGSGHTATMTVTGAGTTMDAHLRLYVAGSGGAGGDGALTISDGATASASVVAVGVDQNTTGTILLTGTGTRLSSIPNASNFVGNVYAGSSGDGTITVQNGAALSASNQLRIAYNSVSSGKLIVGAAEGQTATGAGAVSADQGIQFGAGNGALILNHTDTDYTIASAISSLNAGNGTIRNLAGTTKLTGDASGFSGTLSVEGGTLYANGAMSNSAATVANGATLGGTGTLGSLSVASGGFHAPGNSVGTQTISGNYTLASGSTLSVEVGTDGQMDKVVVGGAVDISGAKLSIASLSGTYASDTYSQVIIDNQGSSAVAGTFGSVTNSLAFYDAAVRYDGGTGNDVVLDLERNDKGYTDVASTPNQKSAAGSLSSLPNAAPLLNNILSLSAPQVQQAYTQLSGNIYPTTRQTNVNLNQQVGQQVGGRLATLRVGGGGPGAGSPGGSTGGSTGGSGGGRGGRAGLSLSVAQIAGFPNVLPAGAAQPFQAASLDLTTDTNSTASDNQFQNGAWSQAVGGRGSIDGDGNSVDTKYTWVGLISGYDTAVTPDLTLGGFFGYINGGSKQSAISSEVDTNTYVAGLYGEYQMGDWHASGQLAWSRIDASSTRDIAIGGFVQTAKADYTDNSLSLDGEVARTIKLDNDLWVEPYAGASALQQFLGNFSETGAGPANLSRPSDRVLTGSTRLGLRLSTELAVGNDTRLVPQAGLAWKHHVGSRENSSTLHFTSGGPDFVVNGTAEDRDTLVANIGTAATFDDNWQAFVSYTPSISPKQTEHSFVLGGRYEW